MDIVSCLASPQADSYVGNETSAPPWLAIRARTFDKNIDYAYIYVRYLKSSRRRTGIPNALRAWGPFFLHEADRFACLFRYRIRYACQQEPVSLDIVQALYAVYYIE